MTLQRSSTSPDAELLKLQERLTELDRVIRLLEEIRVRRLSRTPEVTAFISKLRVSQVA